MDSVEHQERYRVIARFVDGERVDTDALRAALSDEAGREYLFDVVAIREIAREAQTAGLGPLDSTPPSPAPTARDARPPGRFVGGVAAAVVVAAALAGYALGQQRSQVVTVAVLPPLPPDVIVAVEPPPAPTQVIDLGGSPQNERGR